MLKKFEKDFGNSTNYAGYNREEWVERTLEQHISGVKDVLKETTKTGQKAKESQLGVRYSVLMELPYFDPIQFTAIDTMHNIFLGTGKHVFDVWLEKNILTKQNLVEIGKWINQFHVPGDLGRLPSSLSSSYGSFTANQWKHWITIYSAVILKNILPSEHYHCWQLFARSCIILCKYCLREDDINTADLLLHHFCCHFVRLYGENSCTFNMHLHLHLKKTYLDFGPPHTSWCYAFERYNGILGSYITNNKSIEPQIMKKFCQNQTISHLHIPFQDINFTFLGSNQPEQISNPTPSTIDLLNYASTRLDEISTFALTNNVTVLPIPPLCEEIMDAEAADDLKCIYKQLYPSRQVRIMPSVYTKFGQLRMGADVFGSELPGPNNHSSSVVMAYWPSKGNNLSSTDYSKLQVGVIQYFMQHKVYFDADNSNNTEHVFTCIRWKKLHEHYDWYGTSAIICENEFESFSPCCYLPVQRIFYRCAHVTMPVNSSNIIGNVFIACPIPLKYY